jgi:hypothetical protein
MINMHYLENKPVLTFTKNGRDKVQSSNDKEASGTNMFLPLYPVRKSLQQAYTTP